MSATTWSTAAPELPLEVARLGHMTDAEIAAAVQRRRTIFAWAEQNPAQREEILAACRVDVVGWINDWVWTYDPRNTAIGLPTDLPFDLFPRQEELVRWLEERERLGDQGIIEKSRDMGLTWVLAAYMVHRFLFQAGWAGRVGSRKQELVDRLGDMSAIFPKMRYILSRLPRWMVPEGVCGRADTFMRILNPANGASIAGEAGDNIGRGGRASFMYIDEAAFVERQEIVAASVSQTARCIIRGSTPNGDDNKFFQDRESGRVPVFRLHWTDDPRKSAAWYEREIARINDPRLIAQELDINYQASVQVIFHEEWWQTYEPGQRPRDGRILQSWDTSFKKGESNDPSACITALVADDGIYVLDFWMQRVEFPDLKAAALELWRAWSPSLVLIEDKASGQSLHQELARETRIPVHPVPVDADKIARASSTTTLVKNGQVKLPANASWLPEWKRIFRQFNETARIKDPIDAFSQLIRYVDFRTRSEDPRPPMSELAGGPVQWPGSERGDDGPGFDDYFGRQAAW